MGEGSLAELRGSVGFGGVRLMCDAILSAESLVCMQDRLTNVVLRGQTLQSLLGGAFAPK